MAAVIAVGAAMAIATGLAWWLSVPSAPDHTRIAPTIPESLARRWRWLLLRPALWTLSWPHALLRLARVHRIDPPRCPSVLIAADGIARLRRFSAGRSGTEPVLIVHALVSSSTILDLTPQRSLIAALIREGHAVYVLDWEGAPGRHPDWGFDDCVAALVRAEQSALADAGASRLHLVGYCSGATLALARLAALGSGPVASLAALAPPVDLAVPSGMSVTMNSRWLKPVLALDAAGLVPGPLIREGFHALRPSALRSAIALLRTRDAAVRTDQAALAQWSWSMPPVPGGLFFDTVRMHRTNELWNGRMTVLGRPASLASIEIPILVAVATRDHICPAGSSLALCTLGGPNVTLVTCPGGHVSMLTGSAARGVLWPRLAEWLGSVQGGSPASPVAHRTQRRARPRAKARARR